MNIRLVAFGIAKDILRQREMTLDFSGQSIFDLRQQLFSSYPEFARLKTISFAVHDSYQDDAFLLTESDEVVLIPPVSGG